MSGRMEGKAHARVRARSQADSEEDAAAALAGTSIDDSTSTTTLRSVSACNRCRGRKNRCDQKLPACGGCVKAGIKCVGFDPVSKRAIPRSYIYYLETRVRALEARLRAAGLQCPPPDDDFAISEDIKPGVNVPFPIQEDGEGKDEAPLEKTTSQSTVIDPALENDDVELKIEDKDSRDERDGLERLVGDVGLAPVRAAAGPPLRSASAGVSFARVMAAVKRSVPQTSSGERIATNGSRRSSKQLSGDPTSNTATPRDSFFGLHTRPTVDPAPFPDKQLGESLAELYFEHANPQIPILHRGEFEALLERVYTADANSRSSRELYFVNIVFAIGSGIIMDSASSNEGLDEDVDQPSKKKRRLAGEHHQYQPEEYHASAMQHLESFLSCAPTVEGVFSGQEELQAVLLLAGLALLRPVAPGLWYIVGVAMRLAIDLGLHSEEANPLVDAPVAYGLPGQKRSLGRKQWSRDMRRRLWWCTYAFDRLVSTCVGRPFGITDDVITTSFSTMLDDRSLTTNGFLRPPDDVETPSYKLVTRHYLRLRLLQSEILQVLQYRQAELTRAVASLPVVNVTGAAGRNAHGLVQPQLVSPYLQKFSSFRDWRFDMDSRLYQWNDTAPKKEDTGVGFSPLFLELNYWQAVIMLYRQSLAVPEALAGELSQSTTIIGAGAGKSDGNEAQSPDYAPLETDEQLVFMKVAKAGQMVLKLYKQLHRMKLVNYTFLATHHLFMSGVSFLYAIWHSPLVRSQLTSDEVDFTVFIGTSVLSDLAHKCPPADACRDAFARMSRHTISMVESTTGFGSASTLGTQAIHGSPQMLSSQDTASPPAYVNSPQSPPQARPRTQRTMTMPKFDHNLQDLFSPDEIPRTLPLQHYQMAQHQHQYPKQAPTSNSRTDGAPLDLYSGHTLGQAPASGASNLQDMEYLAQYTASLSGPSDHNNPHQQQQQHTHNQQQQMNGEWALPNSWEWNITLNGSMNGNGSIAGASATGDGDTSSVTTTNGIGSDGNGLGLGPGLTMDFGSWDGADLPGGFFFGENGSGGW